MTPPLFWIFRQVLREQLPLLILRRVLIVSSCRFPIRELELDWGDNSVIPVDVHLLPHLESIRADGDAKDCLQKFLKLRQSANMKPIETLTWQEELDLQVTREDINTRCNAFVGVKKHVLEFSRDPHCFCGPDRSSTFQNPS
jgi:hypothetical protein